MRQPDLDFLSPPASPGEDPRDDLRDDFPDGLPDDLRGALLEVLDRYWGYDEFRPLQLEAMRTVARRRDSLLVLPTGGGKSLCFQAPALLPDSVAGDGSRRGPAVVVSPLIALMKDQVDGLVANGVPAACLNSTVPPEERREVRRRLESGELRLLYVSPERLVGEGGDGFRAYLARLGVDFFAIDEAHCISQWGHDFRPSYRELRRLRDEFPRASIHAFTATATERVRGDIVDQLGLRGVGDNGAEVLVGSFDRPNLVYRVLRRRDRDRHLRRVVDRHRDEAGIVYCLSRREVEEVAEVISGWGVKAVPYHAGLSDGMRHRHQEDFLNERVDVVVATVAFGMGIDRSDVRFVIHATSPKSLEHYQQEAGRAGRDGLAAECVLLHSPKDFFTWRRLMEKDGDLTESNRKLLSDMQRYAGTPRCRHRALVAYFGQELDGDDCGACDYCLGELDGLEEVDDPTVLGQKVLSCVLRVRESFGITHVVDVLRGSEAEKVTSRGHHRLSTWGLLDDASTRQVRSWIEQLLDQGYLEQVGDRYPILQVTAPGRRLLKGDEEPLLYSEPRRRGRVPRKTSRAETASWEGVDKDLFEELRELRREVAAERGVPPYIVFHDSVLREMARSLPASEADLLEIHGVGTKKATDFGPAFLAAIAEYGVSGDGASEQGAVDAEVTGEGGG